MKKENDLICINHACEAVLFLFLWHGPRWLSYSGRYLLIYNWGRINHMLDWRWLVDECALTLSSLTEGQTFRLIAEQQEDFIHEPNLHRELPVLLLFLLDQSTQQYKYFTQIWNLRSQKQKKQSWNVSRATEQQRVVWANIWQKQRNYLNLDF